MVENSQPPSKAVCEAPSPTPSLTRHSHSRVGIHPSPAAQGPHTSHPGMAPSHLGPWVYPNTQCSGSLGGPTWLTVCHFPYTGLLLQLRFAVTLPLDAASCVAPPGTMGIFIGTIQNHRVTLLNKYILRQNSPDVLSLCTIFLSVR